MISIKDTKHLLFKYKYVIILLIVTVFFLFYNRPNNETFDINQCTSGEVLDERTALYCDATEQITEDVKNVALQLIRNKCYENIDRCMRVIKEIFTPPPESA